MFRIILPCSLVLLFGCSGGDPKSARQGDGGLSDASTSPRDAGDTGDAGNVDLKRCDASRIVPDGCMSLAAPSEFGAGLCDGLDNNCNDQIDEGCPCEAGDVQTCFKGPPGRAMTGACTMGTQACMVQFEFSGWGECEAGIFPSEEVCDQLDNDCNGCIDELEDCDVFLDCPGAGDSRVPLATPFANYELDALSFYTGDDVKSYRWSVSGSPCDKLFQQIDGSEATPENGQLSYVVNNANSRKMTARFTLSGQYLVNLEVETTAGEKLGCTFPVDVGAPGLRVELCWDKTGPTSKQNPVDLDLHLAMKDQTSAWSAANDCYYERCFPGGIWGHPPTDDVNLCLAGIDPGIDTVHRMRGNCLNPRIDIDNQNVTRTYLPENINLDNPRPDERFQVGVVHQSDKAQATRALVNIYCDRKLRGSFDLQPDVSAFSDVTGKGEIWRVAEIAPLFDGDRMVDCDIAALHPPGESDGFWLTNEDFSITWRD